jgi:hypothetical protein
VANIIVCVPSTREYKPFLESFDNFINKIREKHLVLTFFVKDRKLVDIQNEAAQKLLSGNWDYLLFMDDDHWGHTPEMLECLIKANSCMATIKSYIRHYPYMCALLKKLDNGLYVGIEDGHGYMECDVTGFPMTLIRKDLFNNLQKPYFREFTDGIREWATDGEFCERLSYTGIKPVGCFQHCLAHGDITEENVLQKRLEDGVSTDKQMINFIYSQLGDSICSVKQ